MQFNSFSYLGFLAVAVAIFWQLPGALRRPYVLMMSLIFYATWNPIFVLIPLGICGCTFVIARRILTRPDQQRQWLWCGTALVLAVLGFFKYRLFLVQILNGLLSGLGARPLSTATSLVLPLGISFYSFEAISYLIDTRQRRIKNPRLMDLSLFIMFWPHLMAGPIVRVRELIPQLEFAAPLDADLFLFGIDRLIWGLVQKNAFANVLGVWVDSAFKAQHGYSTIDSWVLAVAFGLQIYFDFAAYSNMAIGAAQLIGIRLPENFRFPYHASTPVDFWSRWHMTLSRWIRDYLFFPINSRFGGSPLPLYLSLLGIMSLIGLWHGAGWNFILWGFLQGFYLVLYRVYERLKETRFPQLAESRLAGFAWRVFTLAAVTLAWIPFRAAHIGQALGMVSSMLFRWNLSTSLPAPFYLVTIAIAGFCVLEPLIVSGLSRADKTAAEKGTAFLTGRLMLRPLFYACGLLLFMIFDAQDAQFIYFQF
ncbi:MAG TPA: MBOAT family O-acyltransferase [Bryobacteraceae bacterium]|jgi:D-alanyl-lipoteichoic acid acyltransferase DltB (MBOAT superfamily)